MSRCQIVTEDGTPQRTCEAGEVLRVLADPRRRDLLAVLTASEKGWTDVDSLCRSVLAANEELERTTLRRELYHVHLPLLEDVGLVDYDDHSGAIRGYHCELVADVLDAVGHE